MRRTLTLLSVACWLAVAATAAAASGDPRLVTAARNGDADQVGALLATHADVAAQAGDGATALHWAAHRGDLPMVDALLRAGAPASAATDTGATPLYLACTNGSDAIVSRLIAAGANAKAALLSGETVLMECARTGRAAALQALLAAGADVNAHEALHDQTALMWAAANRHPRAVEVLLEHGADVRARSRTYSQMVTGGSNATARVEGNYVVKKGGSTPLLFAARSGDANSASLLLNAGVDVNDALPDGTSALVLAAHSGQTAVARVLLDRGADPDAGGAGYTALHAAVLRGELPLVEALLVHHANPNTVITKGMPLRRTSQDFELPVGLVGATPYLLAARFLEVELMRVLAAAGADTHLAMKDGTTPLMAAAGIGAPGQANRRGLSLLDGGKAEGEARVAAAVSLDLSLGGAVNAANKAGDTALHGASAQGYDTVVQLLVDKGAALDAKNGRGLTPLSALTGGRRNRPAGANAFVNTYSEGSHPSTAALLRKLGATE